MLLNKQLTNVNEGHGIKQSHRDVVLITINGEEGGQIEIFSIEYL